MQDAGSDISLDSRCVKSFITRNISDFYRHLTNSPKKHRDILSLESNLGLVFVILV